MAWDQLKSTEQTERERLDRWWSEEFYWDGLAKRSWPGWIVTPVGMAEGEVVAGARRATLQDYWRRGAGSSRESDGRADAEIDAELLANGELVKDASEVIWHVYHLPWTLQNGETTGKDRWDDAAWECVEVLVWNRLAVSQQTQTDSQAEALGPERRAGLQGVMLRRLPRLDGVTIFPMLHLA